MFVLAVALFTAMLFFRPAWPALVPPTGGIFEDLGCVFLGSGPQQRFLGGTVDFMGTVWTFDYVARLLEGAVGTINPAVYAPLGLDQGAAQGYAWLDGILAYPLVRWLGVPAFYNLHVLLMLAGNVVFLHLLFRRAGAPLPIALGLAVAATCNPFTQQEITSGRPTQVHLWFHALFLFFVHRLVSRDNRPLWDGLLAGICLAAACYVYWFSAVAVGVLGALVVGIHLMVTHHGRWRVIWAGSLLTATTLALTLGPTWRLSREVLAGGGSAAWITLPEAHKLSFFGLFQFTSRAPGAVSMGDWHHLWHMLQALGLPLAVFAGMAALLGPWHWRRHLPWALAGMLLFTLPMGASLTWAGHQWPTALSLVEQIFPPIARCQSPARLVVAPMLGLLVAVASLSAGLVARPGAWRVALAWCLGGMLLPLAARFDENYGNHAASLAPDLLYNEVAKRWPGGIINVPLATSNDDYVQQIFHGQPLLGGPGIDGHLVRRQAHKDYCTSNSVLRWLEAAAAGQYPLPAIQQEDLWALRRDGFSAIVVHLQVSKTPGWLYTRTFDAPFLHYNGRLALPLEQHAAAPTTLSDTSRLQLESSAGAGWLLKTAPPPEPRGRARPTGAPPTTPSPPAKQKSGLSGI